MGVPAAPLVLLLLLQCPVAPTTPTSTVSPCLELSYESEHVNLTSKIHGCDKLDLGLFRQRCQLLSHKGIEALSPSCRLRPTLEVLDLSHNLLRELPDALFTNATSLRILRLEGNPLPAVPPAAFQPALTSLSVSCHCDVVGTVLGPCAHTPTECHCLTSTQDSLNVTEFYDRECGVSVGLVGGLAGAAAVVAVLAAVGTAVLCRRRRRAGAAVAGTGRGKQDAAAALRQPRYISRDSGLGAADAVNVPDYENVFVSPGAAPATAQGWAPGWQEQRYSSQMPTDEDYFLESKADPGGQPIYANTLGPSENIYIIPDQ